MSQFCYISEYRIPVFRKLRDVKDVFQTRLQKGVIKTVEKTGNIKAQYSAWLV